MIMTDPKPDIKWFYRAMLILLTGSMSYVVLQSSYNFAHWVPHSLLYKLGVPYATVLYLESNADKLLHPLGAFVLTWLLVKSKIPQLSYPLRSFGLLCLVMTVAEITQWQIGRGFESIDLLLGIAGSYIACCMLSRPKPQIAKSSKAK